MSTKIYAIPPGETLAEQLEQRGMTVAELASRMRTSESYADKLLKGDVFLTVDTARRLENALGIPAHFWLNLEQIYREDLSTRR